VRLDGSFAVGASDGVAIGRDKARWGLSLVCPVLSLANVSAALGGFCWLGNSLAILSMWA